MKNMIKIELKASIISKKSKEEGIALLILKL